MNVIRITTATTTTVTSASGSMRSLRLVVTGSPAAGRITVQNRASPVNVFYVSDQIDAPTTVQVPFPDIEGRAQPVPMKGGIDIITVGTPGIVNAWIEWQKANQ